MTSLLARLTDRSIGARITLGFGLILLLLFGIAAFGSLSLHRVGGTVAAIEAAALRSDQLSDFANGVTDADLQVTRYLRAPGGGELVAAQAAQKGVRARLTRIEALIGPDAAPLWTDLDALDAAVARIVADTKARDGALGTIVALTARVTNYGGTLTARLAAEADPAAETALRLGQAVLALRDSARRTVARPTSSETEILTTEQERVRRELADLKANPPIAEEARALAAGVAAPAEKLAATVEPLVAASIAFEKDVAGWKAVSGRLAAAAAALRERLLAARNASIAEAGGTASAMMATALAVSLAALLVGIASAVALGRSISRPLLRLDRSVQAIAAGDLTVAVAGAERRDEVGALARAVTGFKADAIARRELEARQVEEQSARQRRADRVDQLVRGFQRSIAGALDVVTSAASELDGTSRAMTGIADATNRQAVASSAAAEETAVNVQTVAAAAEEMVASLQEIERQVLRSREVATHAAGEAEATNAAMTGLGSAAERIGAAVTIISTIASQTNLLALNATIEAARAGEAGRGFAVVAAEVKDLAGQTARATEEIGGQIAAIQAEAQRAAAAMRQIGQTVASVNAITAAIAETVVQQNAATSEIARNAAEAASGTQDVSATIARVLAASGETGGAAGRVLAAAADLASQSLAVKQEVDRFLGEIQAA
ncbi:methyl-accepting chemotaxis protein [Methylobacterium sp. JK268]